MWTRTVGAWAGLVVAALTGCTSSGANSAFRRGDAAPTVRPAAAASTAAAPANGSGWARQMPATATKGGDPSALAAPTGNSPQFANQPTGGISPAGGLTPPQATGPATPGPAFPAAGASTPNLMPNGQSLNNLGGGATAAPVKQVASNSPRGSEPTIRTSLPTLSAADTTLTPPMPAAPLSADLPVEPPARVTSLSPVRLVPPTKVRQ